MKSPHRREKELLKKPERLSEPKMGFTMNLQSEHTFSTLLPVTVEAEKHKKEVDLKRAGNRTLKQTLQTVREIRQETQDLLNPPSLWEKIKRGVNKFLNL